MEINFQDESGCSGDYFLFLFLLGMEAIDLALISSMSIVPKLTSTLNFFDLASKKCNWAGQTLSYSYHLLCPASILLQKHTLCYNALLMVGFEQFFMNLELCTCKYNFTPKYETQVLVRLLYSIEEATHPAWGVRVEGVIMP